MRKKREKVVAGARYGRLTVISLLTSLERNCVPRLMAEVRCDCGTEKTVRADTLSSGNTRSCGCLGRETNAKRFARMNVANAKFGGFTNKHPRTASSWSSMMNRCYNKKQRSYKTYGAAGVVVCEGLRSHPQNLVDLIGVRKKAAPSLDRYPIHDGNYTCGQCGECRKNGWVLNIRWTTRKAQSENRGAFNVHLTAFGKTMLKSQWMELTGMSWSCLTGRLKRGWTVERALSTPDQRGNCYRLNV